MQPFAIVTGASDGIGKAFLPILAQDGYGLVLIARRKKRLEAIKAEIESRYQAPVHTLALDLAQKDTASAIKAFTDQQNLSIHILINNAGFGEFGPYHQSNWEKTEGMINVNIKALANLTRLYLPEMLAANQGKILNVASTAAFQPGPQLSIYCATKAFVLSFSEAIAWEVRNTKVTVTALCPGPTASGFQAASSGADVQLYQQKMPTAAVVAQYGYQAMKKGKRVAIQGWKNQILACLSSITPRSIALAIAESLLRDPTTR